MSHHLGLSQSVRLRPEAPLSVLTKLDGPSQNVIKKDQEVHLSQNAMGVFSGPILPYNAINFSHLFFLGPGRFFEGQNFLIPPVPVGQKLQGGSQKMAKSIVLPAIIGFLTYH